MWGKMHLDGPEALLVLLLVLLLNAVQSGWYCNVCICDDPLRLQAQSQVFKLCLQSMRQYSKIWILSCVHYMKRKLRGITQYTFWKHLLSSSSRLGVTDPISWEKHVQFQPQDHFLTLSCLCFCAILVPKGLFFSPLEKELWRPPGARIPIEWEQRKQTVFCSTEL